MQAQAKSYLTGESQGNIVSRHIDPSEPVPFLKIGEATLLFFSAGKPRIY
jgi:hypothetical protein